MSKTVRPVDGTGLPEKAAAALVNSFRLASVTQRLAFHIQAGSKSDVKEFQICCISLAKGIDFAIANNEIPKEVENLPSLLKQVCMYRNDVYTKTAVMVLMISVKHACKLGWFPDSEGQELIALADQIMERFYPFVKLGHVLVSLEVKAGYTILAHDFHISKNMPHSPKERIRLFVVQTDNIDTSACLINPQEVSFMLNGKVVDKRVNISMDSGPQLPTNVTAILKYGTNLLQVMGDSKGHYIIVIAFTGTALPPEKPVLKEYIQSGAVESTPVPLRRRKKIAELQFQMGSILGDLPSFDPHNFSQHRPSDPSNPSRMVPTTYHPTHNRTLPPPHQVITTEVKNILIRSFYQRAEDKMRPKRPASEHLAGEHGNKHFRASSSSAQGL
ncbi:hypothetical protein DY000_02033833 [Brassica cretica]|nr:hypothetical protein DY000_02033833 [Brassica cretica]